jgi:hypothetical protein
MAQNGLPVPFDMAVLGRMPALLDTQAAWQ